MKKLIPPLKQSQRDSRWANTFLGFNTSQPYTIGNFGCLITSLANYCGKTPLEVNNTLKANNGFVSGGLLVWGKVSTIGLNETYASPRYESAVPDEALNKLRSLIDSGHPAVVEVDFYPNTTQEDMHWVLVTGYGDGETFYAVDPWTGTDIDLAVYGGIRRTVYSFRAYDKTLAFEGTIPTVDDCPAKLQQVTQERDRLNGVITGKDEQIKVLKAQIDALTNENDTLSKQNLALTTDLQAEKEHAKVTLDAELSKQRTDMLITSEGEKKALQQEIDRLKKLPTKTIKIETPLDERFKGKSTKVKLQAITTIVLA